MGETSLEVKKNSAKEVFEVRTFYGRNRSESTVYCNVMGKDPTKIAQILIDLEYIEGFPIEKAVQLYLRRKNKGDWLSLV